MRHWRTANGTALCGLPAKQDHLVHGWLEVTCPYCQRRAAAAVKQMGGN
jgi:hypothetical protein